MFAMLNKLDKKYKAFETKILFKTKNGKHFLSRSGFFCQVSIFVITAILSNFVSNLLEFCKKIVLSSFFSFEKKSEGRKLKVCLQPYLKN